MGVQESTADQGADQALPAELVSRLERGLRDADFDLPLLPQVATRVAQLCSDPDCDALAISEVLHRDQAMASHVLRVANSPAMGSRVAIVSLQQAVSRLGIGMISDIAMAISVQGKVFRVEGREELIKKLWEHSLAAGCFAKEIARQRRRNVEIAFLCGLLHDVGMPVVLQAIHELETERGASYSDAVVELALSSYHEEVGGMLARHWALPDQVVDALRYHHRYLQSESYAEAAMITCLADMLAQCSYPIWENRDPQTIKEHEVLEALSLYPDALDAVLGHEAKIAKMVEALG